MCDNFNVSKCALFITWNYRHVMRAEGSACSYGYMYTLACVAAQTVVLDTLSLLSGV